MNTDSTIRVTKSQTWRLVTCVCCLFCLLVHSLLADDSEPFKLEEAQRATRERYEMVFGVDNVTWTWPARQSDGATPPSYPPDGFYDSDLTNAIYAAPLVQDLANRLGTAELLERFVTPTDGDIGNSRLIPVFSTTGTIQTDPNDLTVGAIQTPVSNVTTDDYLQSFSTLVGDLCKLKYIWVKADLTDLIGRDSQCCDYYDAPTAIDCSVSHLFDVPWGFSRAFGNNCYTLDCGDCPGVNGALKEVGYLMGYDEPGVIAWSAVGKAKITADLSNFPSGSARTYLKLTKPISVFATPLSFMNVKVFGQTTQNQDVYYLWTNSEVAVGATWTSADVPEVDTGVSPPTGDLPVIPPDVQEQIFYANGWYLTNQVIVVEPDYQYPISSCQPCASCSCSSGSCTEPGSSCPELGSINYRISLGFGLFNQTAGRLLIKVNYPNALLSTPQLLRYQAATFDQVILTNGVLRQILAPSALVDILPIDSSQYTINFYTLSNAGTVVNGVYQPTGSPYKTYTVANPDAFSTGGFNRLIITENSQGVTTITEYDWSDALQQWQMIGGNNATYQSHNYVWDAAHSNRTDTIIISNSAGQVVSEQIQTYSTFPWGAELVQQQVDPNGPNLTTTYSYYSSLPITNSNYGHVQQVVGPTGHWTTYQYDQFGRTIKTVEQFLDSALSSADNLNRVTTTTYSDTVPQVTIVQTLLGQEVSRRYRVYHPNEVDDIQCQTAGAAWNATNNLVTITKTVPGGVFEGDVQSVANPDGTMSLYQYTTNATTATITVSTGQPNSGGSAIVDGTETVTVKDYAGNQISSVSYDIVSGLVLSSNVTTQTDDFGRPTTVVSLSGTNNTVYGCCGVTSTTDQEGITTSYTYDALKRIVTTTRAGITTSNSYDAAGHVLSTVRIGTDGSAITLNTSAYDVAGRLTNSTDGVGNTISYSETIDSNGHTIDTTTYPDGSTRVETHYQDGRLLSVTGTAVHGVSYAYGVDANGQYAQTTKLSGGSPTSESTKTYSDLVGRQYKTVYADGSSSQSSYNSQGQLVQQVDPDGVTTLYSYDAKGEQVVTAIDMNQNGVIDPSGLDRITSNAVSVLQTSAGIVRRTVTYVWSESGPVLASTADARNDGLYSSTVSYGPTNQSLTVYTGSGGRTVTTTNPDGSYTISQYLNDQLTSATQYGSDNSQIGATTYSYDPQGRLSTQTDARTGATTFTYDNDDRQTSMSAGGQTTSYSYDGLGRQTQIVLPDNGVVNNAYLATGELATNSGARTYPVAYSYDYAGRMATMTTWQNFAGNSGTATTSWNYDSLRGFLTSKTYADSSSVTYSNSAAGRLLKRTWARGVTTTYAYDNSGTLTNTAYSDTTPSVNIALDRRGRQTQVVDGAGTHTMTYNDAGQLLTESFPAGGSIITNVYDSLLRRSTNAFSGISVTYGYDNASRLNVVSDGTHSASYAYLPNSPLVSNIVFATSGTTKMTTTESFDNLNRLTSISSRAGGSPVASYTYIYNAANQRTRSTLADSSFWLYTYDSLGQVTGGQKYWSDGTAVAGEQFGYAFDTIGNRQSSAVDGNAGTYTANSLNEYTQHTVPGYIWELGSAASNATVTINSQPTSRKGQYFAGELTVANSSSAVFTQLVTAGVAKEVGTSSNNVIITTTGRVFVAQSPEVFGYDTDGNLTNDGRWTYSWDGENRLVQMQTLSSVPSTVPVEKLLFGYDYMGRRVSKVVSNFNGSTWSVTSGLNFVYDGWNLQAEAATAGSLVRSYLWGLDLSGSAQGAGGIGGLLLVSNQGSATTNSFVSYDGNGNVVALVDATSGSVTANYEYGPFGETLRSTGTAASANPFHFSTKYTDPETRLLYYGYRYYNPSAGSWTSRDPIGEAGFVLENLSGLRVQDSDPPYAFNGNNAVSTTDGLGLCGCGPDVTQSLPSTLDQASQRFNNAGVLKQFLGCNKIFPLSLPSLATGLLYTAYNLGQTGTAWDLGGASFGSTPGCPQCHLTLTFNGQCHYEFEMNYALYGRAAKLCSGVSLTNITQAQLGAALWKLWKSVITLVRMQPFQGMSENPNSLYQYSAGVNAWIKYGYDGTLPTQGGQGCSSCCPNKKVDTVTIIDWPWK